MLMDRQTITVDIAPGSGPIQRIRLSQGDIGRPMGVYIIQNGVALDCSAYSAELYILKPDGKFYTTQATVDATETNLIKWETALQETPVAGACAAQIRITAGDDDIGTARFVEFVEASPCDMGSASESEVALLTEYVRQAHESAESAERDAETASGAASSASGSASTATTAANTATQAATAATAAADRAEDTVEDIISTYSGIPGRVTNAENSLAAAQDGLAIVANGNTHAAIASGQFVYVKNHGSLAEGLYVANSAIGTNATLTTSNLTADGSGGLNALKAKIGNVGNTDLQSQVTSLNSKMADTVASNAGAHNGIYRGKYLGTSVTAAQYTAIRNGTFDDLYLGDYWTIDGHNWVICDFDYYIRCGSVDVTQHHLVMMPSGSMNIPAGTALYGASGTLALLDGESATSKKWNATSGAPSTHTTAGGYKYSRMRTIIMKAANTIVINAFGSAHVLPFTELYYSPEAATDSGLASRWAWFDKDSQSDIMCKSICDLCNETMVYGQQVWGRGSAYTNVGYEIGIDKFQLAIFALNRNFANIRANWWLRSVSSATAAARVNDTGNASDSGSASAFGVRPRFLLVG